MSVRKARAWASVWIGMIFLLIVLIVEVPTMPKYNSYDLPVLPESEYQNAFIAVSGDTAYLYFVDKQGYIEVDPNGLGNNYTLGLTTTDEYDESRILFAEKYTATIGGETWTAEELPDLSEVYGIPAYAQFSLPCEIGGPHWSNVTLLDQDGNVFIEGSGPVSVIDAAKRRFSFTLGYLLALCGPVISMPESQPPTAPMYSYNGVVLPKLPEWDKTVYPYAVIQWCDNVGEYEPFFATLTVSDQPLFVGEGYTEGRTDLYLHSKNPVQYMNCDSFDGEESNKLGADVWDEFSTNNVDTPKYTLSGVEVYPVTAIYYKLTSLVANDCRLQWANYDIRDLVTDEVCLAKSEPIPVYE